MKEELPFVLVKASSGIGIAAIAGAQQLTAISQAAPVTLYEILVAGVGGLVAGWMLVRIANPGRVMSNVDKGYTIAFSAVVAMVIGPPFANYVASSSWLSEGLWENLAAGLVMGAFVPLSFGVLVSFLRWGQENPDAAADKLKDLLPWGKK